MQQQQHHSHHKLVEEDSRRHHHLNVQRVSTLTKQHNNVFQITIPPPPPPLNVQRVSTLTKQHNNVFQIYHYHHTPPQCPAGQHFDQTTQQCVPNIPPQTDTPFHFTAAGDFRDNTNTDENMAANNPEIVLILGDFSYKGNAKLVVV